MTEVGRWCARALLAAALGLVAAPAAAQAPPEASEVDARTKGKALYEEGVRLMEAGKTAEACPKFESALRVDPGKIGVMIKLAGCYEGAGRVASAKTAYEIAEATAQKAGDPRAADARAKAAALAPRVPRLTLAASPAAAGVSGLGVQRDGTSVDRALLGVPVPVDPGAHVIVVTAPGRKPWREEVQLAEGASRTLEIPDLPVDPSATAPPPPPPPPPPAPGALWSTPRVVGVALSALGAAGLVAGAVNGVLAIQKRDDSNADGNCSGNSCNKVGVGLRSDAITAGNASTALFVLGGAAAVAGVVLIVVAPRKHDVALSVGPAALTLRGRW